MAEPATSTVQPLSLFSRIIGVILSPATTFENIVAAPRPFGVLFLSAVLIGVGSTVPQFTEAGRQATLDMQVRSMEQFGATVTPEMYQALETRSRNPWLKALGAVGALVMLPIMALIFTAIFWAF